MRDKSVWGLSARPHGAARCMVAPNCQGEKGQAPPRHLPWRSDELLFFVRCPNAFNAVLNVRQRAQPGGALLLAGLYTVLYQFF